MVKSAQRSGATSAEPAAETRSPRSVVTTSTRAASLTLPVLIPMLGPLEIDPLHFAVVMVVNMEIALLTPPVGLNLFVLANISDTPLLEVTRGTLPFVVVMLALLVLITYVPVVSLWLPNLLMPGMALP